MAMRKVCTWSGLRNPGSTARSAWKLRIINPDTTSSTSASAISATTSVLRARCRVGPSLAERPPSFSAVTLGSPKRMTGMMPKSNPATIEIPSVNSSTTPLISISFRRGRPSGASHSNRARPARATATPSTPPTRPSAMLSDSNPRAICPRLAPRAVRTANS